MDKSTLSSTTSSTTFDNKFITIPIQQNLEESFEFMDEQQIGYNLLQLNLASMYNDNILHKLYGRTKDTKFYLKNRYILEKLINGNSKPNPKQKSVKQIVQKYDTVYVNGIQHTNNCKVKDVLKNGFRKQLRAKFISDREQFTSYLDQLSLNLKQKQKLLSLDDLQGYFIGQVQKINGFDAHAIVSPNKIQIINNLSMQSSQSQDAQNPIQLQLQQISSQSADSPKKTKPRDIFTICFKNTIHDIKQLNVQKCSFINTKNRCPLVLDFGFAKFIYKNDNQVSHQLICMHLMRYINKVISFNSSNTNQIIQYQIIPQAYGALYEYVDNSMTINQIKKKFKGGIPQYLNYLQQQCYQSSNIQLSSIRKRFAQTFAGFCIAQYLLDIKDRNNSNIMIRNDGSIFHIDLAFIFNATPGGIGFQSCPFKFTKQYLTAMGGFQSDCFKYYQTLMLSNLTKLSINRKQYLTKIRILSSRKQQIICFKKFKFESYQNKIPKKPQEVKQLVEKLIGDSYDNWRTNQYDDYQFNTNKILK